MNQRVAEDISDPIALQSEVRRILALVEPTATSHMLNQRRFQLNLGTRPFDRGVLVSCRHG